MMTPEAVNHSEDANVHHASSDTFHDMSWCRFMRQSDTMTAGWDNTQLLNNNFSLAMPRIRRLVACPCLVTTEEEPIFVHVDNISV